MRLNSLPSAANSSLPSAGTLALKSPRPRRCAACSSRWTSAESVRLTITANRNASARNASARPTTMYAAISPWSVIRVNSQTVTRLRSGSVARKKVVRYSCSAIVRFETSSSSEIRRFEAAGSVDASTVRSRSTRACTSSTRCTCSAYSLAVVIETVIRPRGRPLAS